MKLTISVFADSSLELSWILCLGERKINELCGRLSKIQLDSLHEDKPLRETVLFEEKKKI